MAAHCGALNGHGDAAVDFRARLRRHLRPSRLRIVRRPAGLGMPASTRRHGRRASLATTWARVCVENAPVVPSARLPFPTNRCGIADDRHARLDPPHHDPPHADERALADADPLPYVGARADVAALTNRAEAADGRAWRHDAVVTNDRVAAIIAPGAT